MVSSAAGSRHFFRAVNYQPCRTGVVWDRMGKRAPHLRAVLTIPELRAKGGMPVFVR